MDAELVRDLKARIADRYTAAELAELLDLPVEDLIEQYWDKIADQLGSLDVGFEHEEHTS